MPSPYSKDLRQKVLDAVERGERKSEIIKMFGISRDSIDRWLKRKEESGEVEAKTGYQQGYGHCIRDWDGFAQFVQQHGDKSQAQMADLWSEPISQPTVGRALKRMGWTRKKRPTAIESVTPSNESST